MPWPEGRKSRLGGLGRERGRLARSRTWENCRQLKVGVPHAFQSMWRRHCVCVLHAHGMGSGVEGSICTYMYIHNSIANCRLPEDSGFQLLIVIERTSYDLLSKAPTRVLVATVRGHHPQIVHSFSPLISTCL
ncbi:hypothetical protein K504DRAFT_125830 [Pleomassaria siparia CBS 279.74]|uniref:Uncharacterized protein n=1 Tax=Pleomassaria siparia CBS 279.74 TaxID=1314801 RepID=A0A6G1KJA7_9PLEO|nr:hypothetical protein K504DRAFT_125830 [Pleomassaria siparia CBS 279.74]